MAENGLAKGIKYERWIFEAIKVIGAGSIAAIIPLIVTIIRIDAVLDTTAKQHTSDLTRMEMAIREIRIEFITRDKECRDGIDEVRRALHSHELADNERFKERLK